MHRSPRRGLSVAFAGHRAYQPGDDPRHVDWLVWARSDRLDQRLYEEETRLRALLPPQSGPGAVQRVLGELERARSEGGTDLGAAWPTSLRTCAIVARMCA